jgi:hypothetical protein
MKLFTLCALLLFHTFNAQAGVINHAALSAIQRLESHLSDGVDARAQGKVEFSYASEHIVPSCPPKSVAILRVPYLGY